jgi:hypothetical protein
MAKLIFSLVARKKTQLWPSLIFFMILFDILAYDPVLPAAVRKKDKKTTSIP